MPLIEALPSLSVHRRVHLTLLLALGLLGACAPAASARTYVFRHGPIPIAPYSSIRVGSIPVPHPPVNGFVTRMSARLVDRRGRYVAQQLVMLHHVVFKNMDGPANGCAKRGESFYGTGEEESTLTLPPGYGYPLKRRNPWRMGFMVMNHRWFARTVYIQYRVTVTPEVAHPVHVLWPNVACTGVDPIFDVPGGGKRGSSFRRSLEFSSPWTGRIVSAVGHMHGGVRQIALHEPLCGDRTLAASRPEYGLPSDPIYHVLPQIHEPGPRFATTQTTETGIPIGAGEPLRLDAVYDDWHPHARVMGIGHLYIAPENIPNRMCAPLPSDVHTTSWTHPFRTSIPIVPIRLTRLGANGRAVVISAPRGRAVRSTGDVGVVIRDVAYSAARITVRPGARISWRFRDPIPHDVTSASGPRAFSSQYLGRGRRFAHRFAVAGTYRVYCSLHPTRMSEVIVVKR